MKFVRVMDFETGGLDPATSDVIEVGWVDVATDGTMSPPRQVFARTDKPIDVEAMATHHLRPADIAGGVTREEWHAMLIEGDPVAYVAHKAAFEQSFWPEAPQPWIDTYRCALRIYPDAPRHTNQVLRYLLDVDSAPGFDPALAMPPHRAAPDAYVTAHVFARMLASEGEHRLKRMVAWSRLPGLLPRVGFGKHFGLRWPDVPLDYLEWIGRTDDLDEDVRYTAHCEIQRRNAA